MAPNPLSTVLSTAADPADELWSIFQKLFRHFGPQHWWPAQTPFEVIVGAILTQNTAWQNVEKAIANLKNAKLLSPERLSLTPPEKLARIIRPAGYYNLKARRLLSVVRWLQKQGGLKRLSVLNTDTIRARLLKCYGVGPETADSILLYALNRPVFIIDAYTRRILSRYGLITGKEPYEKLRSWIEQAVTYRTGNDPATTVRIFNEFHALLVRLAKENCRKNPNCHNCPLNSP